MPLTVTKLARACHLARSTVLYYESIGLLARPRRTPGNYRVYTDRDVGRLRQIRAYRDAGLELGDIRSILDAPHTDAAAVLRRRLVELSAGIERLQQHQRAIARLLKTTDRLRRIPMVTKEKWTAIMSAAVSPGKTCTDGTPSSRNRRPRNTRNFSSFCTFRNRK